MNFFSKERFEDKGLSILLIFPVIPLFAAIFNIYLREMNKFYSSGELILITIMFGISSFFLFLSAFNILDIFMDYDFEDIFSKEGIEKYNLLSRLVMEIATFSTPFTFIVFLVHSKSNEVKTTFNGLFGDILLIIGIIFGVCIISLIISGMIKMLIAGEEYEQEEYQNIETSFSYIEPILYNPYFYNRVNAMNNLVRELNTECYGELSIEVRHKISTSIDYLNEAILAFKKIRKKAEAENLIHESLKVLDELLEEAFESLDKKNTDEVLKNSILLKNKKQ